MKRLKELKGSDRRTSDARTIRDNPGELPFADSIVECRLGAEFTFSRGEIIDTLPVFIFW